MMMNKLTLLALVVATATFAQTEPKEAGEHVRESTTHDAIDHVTKDHLDVAAKDAKAKEAKAKENAAATGPSVKASF